MHLAPHDNQNQAIIGANHALVPLVYLNIVMLNAGESFTSQVAGYETCIVPATGTVTVQTDGQTFAGIGLRRANVWDGEPEGVYVPSGAPATITCTVKAEVFIAGAQFGEYRPAFAARAAHHAVAESKKK